MFLVYLGTRAIPLETKIKEVLYALLKAKLMQTNIGPRKA